MAQVQALVASPSGTRYALWRTRYLVWGDGELTLRRLTLANRTARSRATLPSAIHSWHAYYGLGPPRPVPKRNTPEPVHTIVVVLS